MTKGLFAALDIYYNDDEHSAAMNMAIDEALLDSVAVPSIRFYRWRSSALSFGYFGRFADVTDYAGERGGSTPTHAARLASARPHTTQTRASPSDGRKYRTWEWSGATISAGVGGGALSKIVGQVLDGTRRKNCGAKIRHRLLVAAAINCRPLCQPPFHSAFHGNALQ